MKQLMIAALLLASVSSAAQDPLTLDELLGEFGWSFESAEIRTQKVGKGLYVLFGLGGNIAVSIGEQGVLVVDDQFPEMIPKVNAAIREIGGGEIDFAINTHWHFDHAEGNLVLGPAGSWIISQSNSRDMMQSTHLINLVAMSYEQQRYPADALPVITYDDRMQIHFNGEQIDLLHFGPAHTTGDTAVIFRGHNAVHFGDVFNNTGYPFVDADNGGDIDGMIAFCSGVLDELTPDSIVIPDHGEISDYQGLADYIDMLKTTRSRIAKHMEEGSSIDAILAANPLADLDERYGDSAQFIDRVYTSLAKKM